MKTTKRGCLSPPFSAYWSSRQGAFTYVNAGHNPPLAALDGQPYDWLPSKRGFVLAGMEGMRYRQQEVFLRPGDRILLYTDGVTEALNPENALYSEARLKTLLNEQVPADRPLQEQLAYLRADLAAFADGAEQADDITLLLLRINRNDGRKDDG